MDSTTEEMRYGFGQNWSEFVDKRLGEEIIEDSRRHMASMLRTDSLAGKTFMDIGCGSGIHSLAALRLGAERVIAFDYDPDSVATSRRVREFAGNPPNWEIMQGSALDPDFLESLPKADIVYSWGVLHHTGAMWDAVKHAAIPLKPGGVFYIALYSSDNYVKPTPEYWIRLKRRYNRAGPLMKRLLEYWYMVRFTAIPEIRSGRNPIAAMTGYGSRGMTYWTDVKDWLGGYPMEFASLAETRDFCAREHGLSLVNVKTGEGCTEYIFADPAQNPFWREVEAGRVQQPLDGPYRHHGGHCYTVHLPDEAHQADSNAAPRRSRIMVYEDGVMLGLPHSIQTHIADYGGGRFSHWGDYMYFSASDGSDPNTNGRTYTFCQAY